jgi:integrase/recombinase XerD
MPTHPGPKKAPKPVGDLTDPRGFGARFEEYVLWMGVKNFSVETTLERRRNFRYFVRWCEERSLFRPEEITRPILERYARYLFLYRNPKSGRPLQPTSQHGRLRAVRGFFRFLTKKNYLLTNPASELESPRIPKRLPRNVLTVAEVEAILSLPNIDTSVGIRDRAMIEVLYSTGIRRMEIVGLKVTDVDHQHGTVSVYQGKGSKDRIVPIGERALDWVERYRWEVRPEWVALDDDGSLFLTQYGEPMTVDRTSEMVRAYVDEANLGKTGACHLFRHTMATLMLENGADIRFIQEILGHTNLETTKIYTQISIRHLKAIHDASHPSAKRSHFKDGEET